MSAVFGKIVRTAITVTICTVIMASSYNFRFRSLFVFCVL